MIISKPYNFKQTEITEIEQSFYYKHTHISSLIHRITKVVKLILGAFISTPFTRDIELKILKAKSLKGQREYDQRTQLASAPDQGKSINIKTDTESFNHFTEYCLHDGVIWFRDLNSKDAWQKMPLPVSAGTPVKISVDGANLSFLNNKGEFFYKKTLKERRLGKLENNPYHLPAYFRNPQVQAQLLASNETSNEKYFAVDKNLKFSGTTRWFRLPYVSRVSNLFSKDHGKLSFTPDKIFCLSHRGSYNNYYEDGLDRRHHVATGVTTLYTLEVNQWGNNVIRKFDPWSPTWVKVDFALPHLTNGDFEPLNLSASASTMAILGYQREGDTKKLKIFVKIGDIDTDGWNPGLKYSLNYKPENDDVRVAPVQPKWQEIDLPKGEITSQFCIFQTGNGNSERELRILGKQEGKTGFFSKKINETQWKFTAQSSAINLLENSVAVPENEKDKESLAQDYTASDKGFKFTVRHFTADTHHALIEVEKNDKKETYLLWRHRSLFDFLGLSGPARYNLIPLNSESTPLESTFGKPEICFKATLDTNGRLSQLEGSDFKLKMSRIETQPAAPAGILAA